MGPVLRVLPGARFVGSPLLLLMLTIVSVGSLGLTACSEDSPPATMITTRADSFRAVMTVSGTVKGEEVFEQLAVVYLSPDRLSILPVGDWVQTAESDPARSEIIIGDRGWDRRTPQLWWSAMHPGVVGIVKRFSLGGLAELERFVDPPETDDGLLRFNSWTLIVTRDGDMVVTAGPEIAGEQTASYRRHDARFGSTVTQGMLDAAVRPGFELDDSVVNSVIELFGSAEATYEVVVGVETRRVYQFVATVRGPTVDQTYEIVFSDYDQPVTVEPPVP